MNWKLAGKIMLVTAMTAGVAVCGKKDLEDEVDDVVEEQQEAAQQVVETPGDTAKIREEAMEVEAEQKDVQKAMQQELKDKNILTSTN